MKVNIRKVLISILILFSVLLAGAVVGLAGADASPSAPGNETAPTAEPTASVEIDRALQGADGEVEVMVRFEPVEQSTVTASDDAVETLKTEARSAQWPLQRYAARTDGVTVQRHFWIANAALVTVDTQRVSLETFGAIESVERIQENYRVTAPSTPASASTDRTTTIESRTTWGLDEIDAPEAWDEYGTRGEGARVAVLDTGIDADHPDLDLQPGGWAEFDEVGNIISETGPYDCGSHGTHVSGTVSGGASSGTHIGVAPDVELLHGGVLVERTDLGRCSGYSSQVIGGMEWAVENDVDVISLSLGGERYSEYYPDAVSNAEEAGVLVVASAGNTDEGSSNSPGNVYDSFAIGASNSAASIERFSSGELVSKTDFAEPLDHWPDEWIVPDVSAPGADVYSSAPNGGYDEKWGTSMAAPHVAGAAALMESATVRDLSPAEMKRALEESAWKPGSWDESTAQDSIDGKDTRYGLGIINARAAVELVADGTISGRVVDDATGAGIDNASITAVNGSETFTATAGTDGTFELQVEPELRYTLAVEKAGYEKRVMRNVDVGSGETLTVTPSLHGDATITLSVTEAHFGDPIENAAVTATNESTGTYDAVAAAGDGAYRIENVSSGNEYDVTVTAPGYEANATTVAALSSGNTTAVGERLLAGNATIAGTLVDASGRTSDGAALPIENATIEVTRPNASGSLTVANATTAAGRYATAIPGIDANYTVTAMAPYYENATLTTEMLGDGASATIDLEAIGNTTVAGAVNATGVRTENVTVAATTNASGWADATWRNETTTENASVAVPGIDADVTVTVTSRGFDSDSTTVRTVAADEDFGTLSIDQRARYLGVNDLSAPDAAEEGDDVAVEATIVNLGTDDWNETATLHVDGTERASRNVSLNGTTNASEIANTTVRFTHAPDSPGNVTYNITTANESATVTTGVEESSGGGGLPPLPPADEETAHPALEIVDHALSTTEIETGGTVSIETTVANTGDAAGSMTLELTADGETADDASVDVEAADTAVAAFEHTIYEPGEYELAVDGEVIGTVTVAEPEADDEETGETDGETEEADDGIAIDSIPGFGVPVAIGALVSVALAVRRRN